MIEAPRVKSASTTFKMVVAYLVQTNIVISSDKEMNKTLNNKT